MEEISVNDRKFKIIMLLGMERGDFKDNGFFVYGAEADGVSCKTCDYSDKVLLIVGSEGNGLSRLVRENCDEIVSLPMKGHVNSLNASVAAAILIYDIVFR